VIGTQWFPPLVDVDCKNPDGGWRNSCGTSKTFASGRRLAARL
jgi:hypothetical protein